MLFIGQTINNEIRYTICEQRATNMKEFYTRTLAELYVSQGHIEDGLRVYRYLLSKDPENEDFKSRINALMGLRKGDLSCQRKIAALKRLLDRVRERAALYDARRNS